MSVCQPTSKQTNKTKKKSRIKVLSKQKHVNGMVRHTKSVQEKDKWCHVRKCIEHVWSTQSPPWHIQTISLGIFRDFFFSRKLQCWGQNKTSPSDWANKWLYVSFICMCECCAHIHVCLTFKAKVVLLQTARVWHTAEPCWFKALKRHTHTHTSGKSL